MTTIPPAHAGLGATPPPDPDAPPNSTDHGINTSTFPTLWSEDIDTATNNSSRDPIAQLAAGTDVPFDRPPRAVERWNRGDHTEFPATNDSTSIHPPDANLTDSVVITDAYTELFAVQPSTRARLSPTDQPHYAAPNGNVQATVDFRLDAPGRENNIVEWDGRIKRVSLLVDGTVVATTKGSHTPTLSYSNLTSYAGDQHTLTIEAEIVATPTATNDCESTTDSCSGNATGSVSAERVTVRDSITVTEYDLAVSGFRGRYPNGDTGLVVYKTQPWLGVQFPGGDVHGVWRFYTARNTNWDQLVYSTEDTSQNRSSPLVPLRVYAYPIGTGPTPSPRGTVSIVNSFGAETQPPSLPSAVNLDVLTEPYTASYGLAMRIDETASATPFTLDRVQALGLVRGVTATPSDEVVIERQINRTNLTLTVRNRSAETVTVQAKLTDAATGEPISTTTREGYLVVAGHRVNTTGNGTVTTTISRQSGTLAARFEPGPWWYNNHGYTEASDAIYVGGTIIHFLRLLYQLSVPVSLFLGAVFLTDRFTGWRIWPPWRRL